MIGKKVITPTIIDTKQNGAFKCMKYDAQLLLNMLEQAERGSIKSTDFIQPGLLAGQNKLDIVRESAKSILNHVKEFEDKMWILP